MREAYLTGGNDQFDATDAPDLTPEEAAELEKARRENVTYVFESVALTEEFNLKIVGGRYTFYYSDEFAMTRNQKPHPELLRVLRKLTLHMCLLTESLTTQQLYPQLSSLPADSSDRLATQALREAMESGEAYLLPQLENFRCTAVAWKSKGVVLSGEKKARYRCFGKSLKVETPTTTLRYGIDEVELEDGDYPFFELLYNTLNELRAELTEYLEGKYGEGGEQLLLFGKEPEPRTVGDIANELMDALDNDRYTVSVGTPGGEMREVGRKKGKNAAAGKDS
jgi:hypothetical protein